MINYHKKEIFFNVYYFPLSMDFYCIFRFTKNYLVNILLYPFISRYVKITQYRINCTVANKY